MYIHNGVDVNQRNAGKINIKVPDCLVVITNVWTFFLKIEESKLGLQLIDIISIY